MVAQFAQNEQNMNAVERVLHYAELESEGDPTTPNDPPPNWPSKGGIEFKNVDMAYREGLPLVLKDVSFSVQPGEKARVFLYEDSPSYSSIQLDWYCGSNRSRQELLTAGPFPVSPFFRLERRPWFDAPFQDRRTAAWKDRNR